MASYEFAGSDYFSDPGPLIVPVSIVAGGERRGMMGLIVNDAPELGRAFRSARQAGHLRPGGSFTVYLNYANGSKGRRIVLILMGLAIGPGREDSIESALESIAGRIEEDGLIEVAIHVPSEEALDVAYRAIKGWPAGARVRIYHPDWGNHSAALLPVESEVV